MTKKELIEAIKDYDDNDEIYKIEYYSGQDGVPTAQASPIKKVTNDKYYYESIWK